MHHRGRDTFLRPALILAAVLALAVSGLSAPALAQPSAPAARPATGAEVRRATAVEVDQIERDLRALSRSSGAGLTADQIKARLDALPPIQTRIAAAIAALTPQLADVDARLAQLGPAPGPGQPPESADIVQSRQRLTRFHQAVDSQLKHARLLQVEANQIGAMLGNRQRQQLTARLWSYSGSILDFGLWRDFADAAPGDAARLQTLLSGEVEALGRAAQSPAVVMGWILALLGCLAIAVPGRVLLNRLTFNLIARKAPGTRLRRTMLALAATLVATLTPLAALLVARWALAGADAITPVFEQAAPLIIVVLVFGFYFDGLGRALLSPSRPSWRLAPIPDEMVRRLRSYPAVIGATAAFAALVRQTNTILGSSQPTAVASDCVTLLVELAAVGAALGVLGRARRELAGAEDEMTPHVAESRLPWIIAALLAWATLAASLAAVLLGYVEMASWLMMQMIWIATVLASLFLLLRFVDDLFPAVLSVDRPVGRFLWVAIGLSKPALEQISVLLSGLCRLALLLFGWAVILAPFGSGAGDIFTRVTSSELAIRIGHVSISPGEVLGAAAVFFTGLLITRAVRGWLERSYLPKTRMDVGVRTSLAAGVTYLGALVAILLTCGYLGLSLDKIALFASALSVGIGFGLQAIIGNFVSGLILLAERPVKVGDWIAIGELEGDVKRINVRATEIEMPDRSKLIVPNSDLISKTVRNVTHSGALGRMKIVLKVVDSADPAEVRDLILARLKGHPQVARDPAPAVYLSNVADGSLEFTAFAYLPSPRQVYGAKSDLLFQIVPDLKAKGIQLANSTPVVNVVAPDRPIEPKPDGERT